MSRDYISDPAEDAAWSLRAIADTLERIADALEKQPEKQGDGRIGLQYGVVYNTDPVTGEIVRGRLTANGWTPEPRDWGALAFGGESSKVPDP